jgi:predicted DNA-binding protein YlxM (UPF0122 family)
MKSQNIFVYTILAIGIFSIPSLLDNIQAQTNATNQTSGQKQTMSKDTQALMTIDLPELKDTLMNAKQALADGNIEEGLTQITDIENQLLLLKTQPSFGKDIQKIKDSLSKKDNIKALDDLTKVQSDVLKAETEMLKAQLANPMLSQQNNAQDQDDEGDNNGEVGDDNN